MSGKHKNLQVRRENIHEGGIERLDVGRTLHVRADSKAKNGFGTSVFSVPHQHLLNERRQVSFHDPVIVPHH
jgi:hypothetical protein